MDRVKEGGSLADITDIAFNPAIDRNVSLPDLPHSLTLYIARVPGSLDVFLTTLKPRDRVVTAEDVTSCLYYIHLNNPTHHNEDQSRISFGVEDGLPPTVLSPNALDKVSGSQQQHKQTSKYSIARKPVNSSLQSHSVWDARSHLDAGQDPLVPICLVAHPLPAIPYASEHGVTEDSAYTMPCERDENVFHRESRATFTGDRREALMVIRRDPGTERQWNVAHVSDARNVTTESLETQINGNTSACVEQDYIEINVLNKTYDRFAAESTEAMANLSKAFFDSNVASLGFRRYLYATKHRQQSMYKANTNFSIKRRPLSVEYSSSSAETHGIGNRPSGQRQQLSQSAGRQVFAFLDPLNRWCEFTTGMIDKTLKCRLQGGDTDLSELRFNLPSSSRSTSSQAPPQHDKEQGFGFNLGRERAGGGFAGRQAKLGKLIIGRQGLQMLDLVVAANMALWWRVYGSTI